MSSQSDKYICRFDRHPLNLPRPQDPPPGSLLAPSCFVMNHQLDNQNGAYREVIFDLMAETFYEFGDSSNKDVRSRLDSAAKAMLSHLLEYKIQLFEFDRQHKQFRQNSLPGQKRDEKLSRQAFLCTWLENRCSQAFKAIISLPENKMFEAAKTFKPTGAKSFIDDIETNANIIRLIPENEITEAICIKAVTLTPTTLGFIPKTFLTSKVCLTAMSQRFAPAGALKYVPIELRNEYVCAAAVMSNYTNLNDVPQKTEKLCALACINSGLAWDLVPKEFRTPKVEFCASLHGFNERCAETVFEDMLAADPQGAEATADECNDAFLKLHYPEADPDDLSDEHNTVFDFPPTYYGGAA